MKPDREQALERVMDRELKQLPELTAPGALVHRVMLAVHRRHSLPWYRRAWPTWPRPLQAVVLVLLAALSAVAVMALADPVWVPGYAGWEDQVGTWKASLGEVMAKAGVLLKGLMIAGRALGKEFLLVGTALVLLGYFSSVALATACYRLARQRV